MIQIHVIRYVTEVSLIRKYTTRIWISLEVEAPTFQRVEHCQSGEGLNGASSRL